MVGADMDRPENTAPFGKIIKVALITLAIGIAIVAVRSAFFPDTDHPPAQTANPNQTYEGTNPPHQADGLDRSSRQ